MTASTSLLDRYQAMPRAIRWAVIAGIITVLVLAWDEFVRPVADDWNRKADEIESQLATVRSARALALDLRKLDDTVVAIGPVDLPGDGADARAAISNAVVDVCKEHSVSKESFDLSGGGTNLPRDLSRGIVRTGKRLQSLSGTLKFESTPETAIAVIRAFELRPEIESVSKVQMTKIGDRKVKVNLTLETWIAGESRRRS